MREIKFRAWEEDCQFMNDHVQITIMDEERVFEVTEGFGWKVVPEKHVMQYTGLKDKNGIEIYEGDIVSDQYANIYTPIFRNGIYMAYNVEYLHLTEQEPSTQFNVVWKNGCEVIGNIYENPELLEVK